MLAAVRAWAAEESRRRERLVALGYFGSYARGDAGFGSDLDLVAIVRGPLPSFLERSRDWPVETLPVPAEILVYDVDEWWRVVNEGGRFARVLTGETVWIAGEPPAVGD